MAVPKSKISKRRRKAQINPKVEHKFMSQKISPKKIYNKSLYKEELLELLDGDLSNIKESPYTASMLYQQKSIVMSTTGVYKNKNKFSLSKKNRRLFWRNKRRKELHRREELQKNAKLLKSNSICALEYKRLAVKNWTLYKKQNGLVDSKVKGVVHDTNQDDQDSPVVNSEGEYIERWGPFGLRLSRKGFWIPPRPSFLIAYRKFNRSPNLRLLHLARKRLEGRTSGYEPPTIKRIVMPENSDERCIYKLLRTRLQYMDVSLLKKEGGGDRPNLT